MYSNFFFIPSLFKAFFFLLSFHYIHPIILYIPELFHDIHPIILYIPELFRYIHPIILYITEPLQDIHPIILYIPQPFMVPKLDLVSLRGQFSCYNLPQLENKAMTTGRAGLCYNMQYLLLSPGIDIIFTLDEVVFVQNMVFYIATAYRTPVSLYVQ